MTSDRRMDLADWLGVALFAVLLVYGFASGTAFGQPAPNACQSSATCAMADAKISCVTSAASFPACTTARKGDIRCAGSLLYVCDGSGWVDIATSAAGYVLIAGSQMTGGLSTPQVDAGVMLVGKGSGTNGLMLGNARLCLGNFDGGAQCAPRLSLSSATAQQLLLRMPLLDAGSIVTQQWYVEGESGVTNLLAGVDTPSWCAYSTDGQSYSLCSGNSGKGWSQGFCPLDGGTCWTGQAVGDMKTTADNIMTTAVSLFNSDSTAALGFRTGTTGINPSGNWTFQSVNRDTNGSTGDGNTVVGGNSSSQFVWRNLLASWSAQCIGSTLTTACSEDTNFTGGVSAVTPWVNQRVTCAWNTVGTGGATGVVIQVYDKSTSTELCHCTLGACTTAANSPLSCSCTGTYTASDLYVVRQTSATDCTADPADIFCNVQYKQ